MALRIIFGGSDMLRVVGSTNENAGALDEALLFSGDYRPARVKAIEASTANAFVSFGTTYAQPPLVFGALDTGAGQQAIVSYFDYRWSNVGGVSAFWLQGYSYCAYYIVTASGIYQYTYNRSGTFRYLVLEP